MFHLPHDRILALQSVAIDAGLADRATLDLLLAGLPPRYVATLPSGGSPAVRFGLVLNELNKTPPLLDGTFPLEVWLHAAIAHLGTHPASLEFRAALRALTGRRAPAIVGSPPSPPPAAAPLHVAVATRAEGPRLVALQAAYASGNLVVFAGADLSAAAGLPTLSALAAGLLSRLRAEKKPEEAIGEVEDLLRKGRLVDALSAVKLALGRQEFDIAVGRACDDKGRDVPEVARAIASLAPRLRAVITTNLDRFLERAFGGDWEAITAATGDLAQRRHYIFKIHGTLSDRSTWVFSRDQYDAAVFGPPQARDAFSALFRACPLLFVGCGLQDDDLDHTFARVRALSGGQPPAHYALVPAGVAPFKRKQLEDAGLRLIQYDDPDGKHAEVARILRSLEASGS
jgi:hypothetical protein